VSVDPDPTTAVAGFKPEITGFGLSNSTTTVGVDALTPPSLTVTLNDPAVENWPAAMLAVTCVAVTKFVGSAVPFTDTIVD
jgi:hypothetical protein